MEVTKLKVLDSQITVEGTVPNGIHTQSVALRNCPDTPEQSLVDAMAAVRTDIVNYLGLPKSVGERIVFSGYSMSKVNGARHFVFTSRMNVRGGVVVLKTPTLRERIDGESGDLVIPDLAMKRIEALAVQAAKYFTGAREQYDLGLAAEG